ncbi:MAG: cytochrome C [Gammaproteobacteria bacterium]|nr:cytochrome C [Gammaproteobacteria bacterium]
MMKYKKHSKFALFALIAASLAFAIVFLNPVQAKPPVSKAEMKKQMNILLKAVKKGDDLWHTAKLGTNGLACGNCHPDGSASNPHTWPKYQTNLGKVGTLREMINWCILVPMQGPMLDLGGDDMIAMEAYATYTHRGVKIAPAKDEQHGAVPVKSGPGYPLK